MTYGIAIQQALYDEMKLDENVLVFGEDIQKNLYGYTGDLLDTFGENRVINIPLSEASIVGMISGAAMCGLRPILDLTLPNFMYIAMDQLANIAAKTHYMYNGEYKLPLTIFCTSMQGSGNAAQHSDRLHSLFMSIPGLKIICPTTPQDAYSMLRAAIRDDNPVLSFMDRSLFWQESEVDKNRIEVIGKAKIIQEGTDISIVTVAGCSKMITELLPELREKKISSEVIDLRTVIPIDIETILNSVRKTGKLVICDTSNKTGSVACQIAALVAERGFEYLKKPIQVAACEDIPIPFTKELEQQVLVTKEKIQTKIDVIL